MSACPSPDQLRMLMCRSISEGLPADLDAHVQNCPACQELLSRWNADGVCSTRRKRLTDSADPLPAVPGYEILEKLGRGGMGIVWKARHKQLGRVVALKVIRAGAHADTEERKRFLTEAQAIACLQHPHIVQIHEVGEAEGQPFCALEFVEGQSLDRRLAAGPLPALSAATLVLTLARAMHYAHEQEVIHRDLKPSNVLLAGPWDAPLEQCRPKITDFGLAKRLNQEGDTHSGAVLGTPSYMAPEQAEGKSGAVGPRTDVYGLGAILYQALAGRPPFQGTSALHTLEQVRQQSPVAPRHWQPKVPRDLETICLKCLEKEPHKRYPTAADLADDLGRFLHGESIRARPARWPGRVLRWCRRRPLVAAFAAVAVVATILGSAGVLYQWRQADLARREADARSRDAWALLARFIRVSQLPQFITPDGMSAAATILDDLEAKYTAFADWPGADQATAQVAAGVATDLAYLNNRHARFEQSLAHARRAVQQWERLLNAGDRDYTTRFGLARTYVVQGFVSFQLGYHSEETLRLFEEAQDRLEALAEEDPGADLWWYRATTRQSRARLLAALGRRQEAVDVLMGTVPLLNDMEQSKPGWPHNAELRAALYAAVGRIYQEEHRWAEAYQCWQHARSVGRPVVDVIGGLHICYSQAEACDALATVCRELGRSPEPYRAEALRGYGRHVRDALRLMKDESNKEFWLGRLRDVARRICHCVKQDGANREALSACQEILEQLAQEHPEDGVLALVLVEGLHSISGFHREARRPGESLGTARQAADLLARHGDRLPAGADARHSWAVHGLATGICLRKAGAPAEALSVLERSRKGLEELAARESNDLRHRRWLREVWRHLGNVRSDLGESEGALAAWWQSVTVQRQVLDAEPTQANRNDLATCYGRLTHHLLKQGQLAEALACQSEEQKLRLGPGGTSSR